MTSKTVFANRERVNNEFAHEIHERNESFKNCFIFVPFVYFVGRLIVQNIKFHNTRVL